MDFKLDVGTVSQTIEVSATTENLDVDTSNMGETIQSQTILELPDNGRNPFDFALLVPGVNNGPGNSNSEGASTPHIAGSRNANNEVMIDGMTDILPENNVGNNELAYTPVEDSVEEENVQISVMPADSGRFSGGVISLITKSGTNQLHGSFYEFVQNGSLDAVPFGTPGVANKNPIKPDMHQYQTGGTVGGPILIPHVFNGRNKAFFFFDYENSHQNLGQTNTYSVPNPAWYGGDFTSLFGTTTPVLFDPDTYGATTAGQRDPFVSNGNYNVLPSSRISTVAQKALAYFPKPNIQNAAVIAPGLQNAGQYPTYNNFQQTGTIPTDYWHFDGKVDVDVTKQWHSFLRYSESHQIGNAFNDYNNAASPGNYGGAYHTNGFSGTFNNTVTFSPTLLGEFRYGFSKNTYNRLPTGGSFDPTTLGFDPGFGTQAGLEGQMFPHFGFNQNSSNSQFSDLGPLGYEEYQEDPIAQTINGSLVKIAHGHTLKVGGEFRELRLNFYQWAYPSGTFNSSDEWTDQNPGNLRNNYDKSGNLIAGSGFSLASLLLGLPDSGDISEDARLITTSQYWAFYGQDDWKVSPKLTLNMGLRYDFDVPRQEVHNNLSLVDLNAASPLQAQYGTATSGGIKEALAANGETCPACGNLLGATTIVGSPGAQYGRRQGPTQTKDFGPRFGLAYNATTKIVLRAGVGVIFQPSALQASGSDGGGGVDGFSTTTNFQPSINNETSAPLATLYGNDTTQGTANTPFPNGYNTPQANTPSCLASAACVAGIDVGNSIGGNGSYFGSYRNPYEIEWNGNVQFAVPFNMKLELGYLANKGMFLIDGDPGLPFDQLPTTTLLQYGCGPQTAPNACPLTQSVPNPFASVIGSTTSPYYQAGLPLGGSTVAMGQLLKRYPQYASILSFRKGDGSSMYNAFTIRADKNMSHGLTFTLSFTDGREYDNGASAVTYLGPHSSTFGDEYNRKAEWSIGAQNIDYQIAGSFLYELPFGHGRPFLNSGGKGADKFINGWQISGIENWSTGTPLLLSSYDNGTTAEALYANNAPAPQRPSMGPVSPKLTSPSHNAWFNTNGFVAPPNFTVGNAPRTMYNINNPSYQDLDLQLAKNTAITERMKVQLRLEMFNAFNHPVLGTPDTNLSDGTFGVINSYSNNARRLQVAAKVTF